MTQPILITGVPRGLPNVVAAAINYCGAFGGVMAMKNKSFEEGEYSNDQIRDKVVKPYFDRNGWDNKGQFPLPKTERITYSINWEEKIKDILHAEGWKGEQWMYKDSKSCLIWPVWSHAFPNAKWIIVRRRTGDIVQSCLKTGYMMAYEDAEGWVSWVHQYEAKFVEMIEAGLNCKVVWPERIIDGDFQQFKEMIEWVGLSWNDKILSQIEPMLWSKKKVLNGK
jgi:hypothetical protein